MKQFYALWRVSLCLFVSLLALTTINAQCLPDSTFQDAPLGVYPTPFDSVSFPNGGLNEFPATIGEPYSLTFTVKLTDSVLIPPFNFDLAGFALNEEGIMGLPIGLEYSCNPPNCIFTDSMLGCIIIEGTPDTINRTGDYNLQIQGTIFSVNEDSLAFGFPSPLTPGEYLLTLTQSDSMDTDGDGVSDAMDNCIETPNSEQVDEDGDNVGAACDCDDSSDTGRSCDLGCQPFYLDEDGDGFGNPLDSVRTCVAPDGYVSNNMDCDDTDEDINPEATELFSNGIDDNCDGLIDEMLAGPDADSDGIIDSLDNCPTVSNTEQIDFDEDNFGAACDCNDSLATVNPAAEEILDNDIDDNCDGQIDDSIIMFLDDIDEDGIPDSLDNCPLIANLEQIDFDEDSFGAACDCNDSLATVNPAAEEIIDNDIDDNCNGEIDEGPVMMGPDSDGDGISDDMDNCPDLPNSDQMDLDNDDVGAACDCDDAPLTGAACSEGCTTFYADNDGDGFGDANIINIACIASEGFVDNNTDCDDNNVNINPLAQEIPANGIDDNCDGNTDESSEPISWFIDNDRDGFGNPMTDSLAAAQPRGYVNNELDCDDTNALVYEGALEIDDKRDNNCDGLIDNFDGDCNDLTAPGTIGEDQIVCPEEPDPVTINNLTAPSGGSGELELWWMMTTDNPESGNAVWTLIPGAHALSYDPTPITKTTSFRRCARRKGCIKFFQETAVVTITFAAECEDGMIIEIFPCLNTDLTVSSEIVDPDCDLTNGSIDITVRGGVAPYSFLWEPDFGDVEDIDSLAEGSYSAVIMDAEGCFVNFNETLSEPDTCNTPPEAAPRGFKFGKVAANVLEDKIVWVEWETENEKDESHYILEQSKEGTLFSVVSTVKKAKGQTNSYYQNSDNRPILGTSFYRIKYLETSGESAYSPILQVLVAPDGTPTFLAYPNPFSNTLTVDFLKPLEESVTLVILDNLGQTIYRTTIARGELRVQLDLPETAKGLFTLEILSRRDRVMQKILKVE